MISNPKAAKFKTHREPLNRLKQSSHIRSKRIFYFIDRIFVIKFNLFSRILIFSQEKIINVEIFIDGKMIGHAKQSIDNKNLFVFPCNTNLYDDENLHEISVQIQVKEKKTH